METFQHIDVTAAYKLMNENNAVLVDIRDHQSFTLSHPENAFQLTNESMATFMAEHGFEQPVLVLCYRGISSQGAAEYLINQGYDEVYSVDGGFDAWQKQQLPVVSLA